LTPEIASARSRLNTLKNLALTETLQRALDNLELIDNRQEIQNAGGSAMNADIAKILLRKEIAEEILDKALTPALAASRAQRDSLMAKAAQEDTDAARASAHVADIRSKVVTQELIDSRNRLEELRSAARAVIK